MMSFPRPLDNKYPSATATLRSCNLLACGRTSESRVRRNNKNCCTFVQIPLLSKKLHLESGRGKANVNGLGNNGVWAHIYIIGGFMVLGTDRREILRQVVGRKYEERGPVC